MSQETKKHRPFFANFLLELQAIFSDILFVFQHFFHWTLSRCIIFVWGIILGILLSLPFFLLAVIMAWLDPISWLSYFAENTQEGALIFDHLASHPYWFISIIFLLLTSAVVFLLASSYSLVLLARLSHKYIQRKCLDYRKNFYFSKLRIQKFLALFSWNFLYILSPILIWCGVVFFLYFFYHATYISFHILSYSLLAITLLLIGVLAYVSYRILFGYIILSEEKDGEELKKAKKYLQASIEITKGKNIIKFFFLIAVYALITFPFQYIDTTLSSKVSSMKDALAFKAKLVENIDASEMAYYKYLSEEYETYSNQDLIEGITTYSYVSLAYFFVYNLIFGGMLVFLLTSFYVRVLVKQKN